MEHLGRVLDTKWFIIGQELGIGMAKLNQISINMKQWNNYNQLLEKVFKSWEANPKSDKPYTWETVMSMLTSHSVNSHYLAVKIQKKLQCK